MSYIYYSIRNLALGASLLTVMASCKKSFLEIEPKGIIIAEKTSDYDLLLNNLELINAHPGNHALMGDEIATVEPNWTGATFQEKKLFQWQTDIYTPSDDAAETNIPAKNLYIYNKVIGDVMSSKDGSEDYKKTIRGEALACRAWINFLWVNYFGKPYTEATAATDPAFALITEADVNNGPYTKATVKQMYDQIISDLTAAIQDIAQSGVYGRTRMSKATAQGLLAKAYVFMGKYEEALPLLNESISNLALSTSATRLLDYNTTESPVTARPVVAFDTENVFAKQFVNSYTNTNKTFWLTPEAIALYGSTDLRRGWIKDSVTLGNGTKLFKRNQQLMSFYGLRVPDLYLLRAEVKARLNDLTGAVADLVYLRERRMPVANAAVPATASADRVSLVKFVIEERIREFSMQGYRWFDMRRLSVDPLFTNAPAFQHRVYAQSGAIQQTFTLKAPDNFIFLISPKLQGENPGLAN